MENQCLRKLPRTKLRQSYEIPGYACSKYHKLVAIAQTERTFLERYFEQLKSRFATSMSRASSTASPCHACTRSCLEHNLASELEVSTGQVGFCKKRTRLHFASLTERACPLRPNVSHDISCRYVHTYFDARHCARQIQISLKPRLQPPCTAHLGDLASFENNSSAVTA
jgi:hypothetical protein